MLPILPTIASYCILFLLYDSTSLLSLVFLCSFGFSSGATFFSPYKSP